MGKIVVNADDMGMSSGTTAGIVRAHQHGVVTSTSLVVTTPGYYEALGALQDCPGLGVGLHFSLSAGRPAADPRQIPLLIGPDGYFRHGFVSLIHGLLTRGRSSLLEQVGIELEAQLDRLRHDGIRPDHINGERHVHLLPGIFERIAESAAARGVPYVRSIDDVGLRYLQPRALVPALRSAGPIKLVLLEALSLRARATARKTGFPKIRYATLLCTGRMDLVLDRILADPPRGWTEVAVHPGIPEQGDPPGIGNAGLTAYLRSEDRRKELEACVACRRWAGSVELVRFSDLEPVPNVAEV